MKIKKNKIKKRTLIAKNSKDNCKKEPKKWNKVSKEVVSNKNKKKKEKTYLECKPSGG